MTRAYVHLSDIWGDTDDALGLRAAFDHHVRQADSTHRIHHTENADVIVEVNDLRAEQARERWQQEAKIGVASATQIDWSDPHLDEVWVDCAGASTRTLNDLDRTLRSAGFRRAGRAWGEAGQSRRYVRATTATEHLRAALAQTKVRAGQAVVHVRDAWLAPDRREAVSLRLRSRLNHHVRTDVLDDRFGRALPPVPRIDLHEVLPAGFGPHGSTWSVALDEPDPLEVARRCHTQHGVWPISFSYPGEPLPILAEPAELVAPIIPGFPYSFDDERAYLETYRRAYLGITHRKAGWDCFRHVEILASGAVPLMFDAGQIPEFSMVHYPKRAMVRAAAAVTTTGGPPETKTRQGFREHFDQHLTSRAMAQYLLRAAGLESSKRILFVDAALPGFADYLSVLTLIGLKQVLGPDCSVMHPVDYIYADTKLPTQGLYGRGFGYTRVLDGASRSSMERGDANAGLDDVDAIVVGSIARNVKPATDLLRRFPAERTIWIHGEDTPPTIDEVRHQRASGAHLFIRAIHTGSR